MNKTQSKCGRGLRVVVSFSSLIRLGPISTHGQGTKETAKIMRPSLGQSTPLLVHRGRRKKMGAGKKKPPPPHTMPTKMAVLRLHPRFIFRTVGFQWRTGTVCGSYGLPGFCGFYRVSVVSRDRRRQRVSPPQYLIPSHSVSTDERQSSGSITGFYRVLTGLLIAASRCDR